MNPTNKSQRTPKSRTSNRSVGLTKNLKVGALAEDLFRSVSTSEGLRGWWSTEISGSHAKGKELKLGFRGGHIVRISLAKAISPSIVEWNIKEHKPFNEWNGTRLSFSIEADGPDRSMLTFMHVGLLQECECYEVCQGGWDYYMASLKSFAEKGKGTP